jgi:hypothetical protein
MRKYVAYLAMLIAGTACGTAAYLVAPLPRAQDRPPPLAPRAPVGATRERMARLAAQTAAREAAHTARRLVQAHQGAQELAAD